MYYNLAIRPQANLIQSQVPVERTIKFGNVCCGGSRISRRGVVLIGGVDSRGGSVLKILYVETKESGPLRGVCAGHIP